MVGNIVPRAEGSRGRFQNESETDETRDKAELVFSDASEIKDPEEERHRRQAVAQHYRRASGQIFSTIILVALAASAWPAWRLLYSVTADEPQVLGPLFGFELPMSPLIATLSAGAAIVGLFAYLIWLWWYRRERLHDWAKNAAHADARQPEKSAAGYMELFRLYARTKRRAFFTMAYGVAFGWLGIAGVLQFLYQDRNTHSWTLLGASLAIACIALLILFIGFDLSRRYLPGKILVTRTLILSTLATTSQTDYHKALEVAMEYERRKIEEKPWWFYSFARPPKKNWFN
ncbi:hypothetical protein DDZ18_09290 [Marinicauda salina]|uniref:Uncharacterized protein n=1 Tax=Marinicauda salina TaxID=2135793 RepID=A0A2U2BSC3_9PROT|nr:hypothetical protein [Marinicauda salina]PWE16899.1 hypothetical protein DDZ18_09290 [Marinicauda salina]